MKQEPIKATVIDVRTNMEYESEHYPNAINIPLDEIMIRLDDLKKLPKPIVAYCRSGNRSAMAVSILRQHGITEVVNGGGLQEMMQA